MAAGLYVKLKRQITYGQYVVDEFTAFYDSAIFNPVEEATELIDQPISRSVKKTC
ncbi:hypothetical protein MNBD_GAMMA12-3800 [hydrothermal vent metagenome]|uniref:Uncharacterized protein n=1 Tax=hydrothermal vent metagenome TaxID=652676 RepID=A0A3B0Y4Y0_9ZZZZ